VGGGFGSCILLGFSEVGDDWGPVKEKFFSVLVSLRCTARAKEISLCHPLFSNKRPWFESGVSRWGRECEKRGLGSCHGVFNRGLRANKNTVPPRF
jgi:hypothetical protein